MTQNDEHQKRSGFQATDSMTMVAVAGQVGCVTLLSVLLAVFLGLYLDRLLGTRPIILILLVLGSAPLSLLLTYYIAIRATRRVGKPITTKREDSEETRGES
ncbi:MAG: AtpZ/AtpI family protein [Anaerolineales bacterium]|nr:AtpZ/AtpI family protein [Anaerolineales bacterium]